MVRDKPEFAIINIGTLRTSWLPGEILFKDVFGMSPFENNLATFKILGANLEKLVRAIHKNNWAYSFHNLKVTMTRKPWEVVKVVMGDGSLIDPNKMYVGLATDFQLLGGDGYKGLMGTLYHQKDIVKFGILRDHIAEQITRLGVITAGWFDPKNPRIEFVDPLPN